MMKLTIASGTDKDFFRRGRELASKLDRGEQIPEEQLLTLEDPTDIVEIIDLAAAIMRSEAGRAD